MEILLLLLLIVGVVVFFSTRKNGANGGRRASRHGQTPSPKRRTVEPFDETTSRRVRTEQVLKGRVYVTDGDTITLAKTQIRLFGIDAPELAHPYGKIAKNALYDLCKGQTIRALVTAEDSHGRTVARCFLPDGRDLSAEMVKLGLAIDWAKFSGGEYRSLELPDVRKKLWLADARQKGQMWRWEKYEAQQRAKAAQRHADAKTNL